MAITNTRQAKDFTAGAPNIILKGDLRPKEEKPMKMAGPDYVIKRMEDLLDLGYDYDTAGKLAMDEDAYRDAMDKGPIDDYAMGGRVNYGLGSLVKSVKKAVKGVVKGVKKNPLLAVAALNFAPMLAGNAPFFGIGGLKGSVKTFGNPLGFLNLSGDKTGGGAVMDALKVGGAGGVITGLLSSLEREEGESDQDFMERTQAVKDQLKVQFQRLNPQGSNESNSDYDIRIDAMVANAQGQQGSFAMGGRAGFNTGGFGSFKDFIESTGDNELMELYSEFLETGNFSRLEKKLKEKGYQPGEYAIGGRVMKAMGDTASDNAMQAAGIEGLPIRQNPKGVKELDLRETGGFIPPVGVKEKADDIPAMLSNNEFVFTADAVRAAGGGSVNKGAQRMYDLMKNLESKVV